MTDTRYLALGDVVADELFPDLDLALRRGRHIDREDNLWYTFLVDAQALLEAFYRRFGCELTHPADGYFYLLPTGDKLGRRHLSVPEMLVGQALTLLYLDPATLQSGGVIKRADALSHLAAVMGSDALTRAFNPKRKRVDERVAQETVRGKFAEALRRLAALGFVDLLDSDASGCVLGCCASQNPCAAAAHRRKRWSASLRAVSWCSAMAASTKMAMKATTTRAKATTSRLPRPRKSRSRSSSRARF